MHAAISLMSTSGSLLLTGSCLDHLQTRGEGGMEDDAAVEKVSGLVAFLARILLQ